MPTARSRRGTLPDLIDPVQPMMAIRALTHEAAPGVTVACRMEGDTYEMEDQRNWTDASYKTYVLPLALPWPYTIARARGSIKPYACASRALAKAGRRVPSPARGPPWSRSAPRSAGVPRIGLGSTRTRWRTRWPTPRPCGRWARRSSSAITTPGAGTTARRSKESSKPPRRSGPSRGWRRWRFGRGVRRGGRRARRRRRRARLPVPVRPSLAGLRPEVHAARQRLAARPAGHGPRRGGAGGLPRRARRRRHDQLLHRVQPQAPAGRRGRLRVLHDGGDRPWGDDVSVTEGLEALPAIALSARTIAGDKPICVGPSAIGMRMNPYGEAPFDNPATGARR